MIHEVFDVGANTGQYALRCRNAGFTGKIFSFEPLISENLRLIKRARYDDSWFAIAPVALGLEPGLGSINVSDNSVSSSILEMEPSHLAIEPKSKYVGAQETIIESLDFYFKMYHKPKNSSLLKLDIQGYELFVLRGASEAIKLVDYIQIEMSIENLYEESSLFSTVHSFLETQGFQLKDIILGVRSPITHALAQIDGVYKRVAGIDG